MEGDEEKSCSEFINISNTNNECMYEQHTKLACVVNK
jgi:hypothetical protein